MKRIENETSRMGKSSFMQQIALLFLIGFFVGAAFYYIFKIHFPAFSNPLRHSCLSGRKIHTHSLTKWYRQSGIMGVFYSVLAFVRYKNT